MRIPPKILVLACLATSGVAGCRSDEKADGERPGVLRPAGSTSREASATSDANRTRVPGSASASGDRVIAEVEGVTVVESQLMPVLVEGYGLDVLLKVMQREMARAMAVRNGVSVSPADVEAERELTLALAFPDQKPEDYENLLGQLLAQQRVTRAEFAVVMQANATLRATVKAAAADGVTEEAIRNEFNTLYGERVRVRHIAVSNLQEVAQVQRRLNGDPKAVPPVPPEPFDRVAREMSQNRITAPQGGEMQPFARATAGVSPVFAEAAFALKPGEVSADAVQDHGYYHIIKSEERIAPKAVKFEDVHDSVREELVRRRENGLMAARRAELAQLALRSLKVLDPVLDKQFEERLAAANPKPAEKDDLRRSLDAARERLNPPATTTATTAPATSPTTAPRETTP